MTAKPTSICTRKASRQTPAPGGPIERLVRQGHLVLAVDLRGIGETVSGKPSSRGIAYYVGSDWKDLYLAYLLGTSYLAMRAEDTLVCARFLQSYRAVKRPNRVHVTAVGQVGPARIARGSVGAAAIRCRYPQEQPGQLGRVDPPPGGRQPVCQRRARSARVLRSARPAGDLAAGEGQGC